MNKYIKVATFKTRMPNRGHMKNLKMEEILLLKEILQAFRQWELTAIAIKNIGYLFSRS